MVSPGPPHKPAAQDSSLTLPIAEVLPGPLRFSPKDPQICPLLAIALVSGFSISCPPAAGPTSSLSVAFGTARRRSCCGMGQLSTHFHNCMAFLCVRLSQFIHSPSEDVRSALAVVNRSAITRVVYFISGLCQGVSLGRVYPGGELWGHGASRCSTSENDSRFLSKEVCQLVSVVCRSVCSLSSHVVGILSFYQHSGQRLAPLSS